MTHASTTRGVVFIHSAPAALCPHVEWAIAGVLGAEASLEWIPQPAQTACYRAELSWQGASGTGAKLASAMRGWQHLRYEITEEPSAGFEGERYSYTPSLGIFHAVMGVHGDIVVPEDRLRFAMLEAEDGGPALPIALEQLMGKPWDDELETFRYAGDGAPVRWLHQVI
ncbi:MAG TPA: DUF3145 domain-containing protein [Actinomycetes bacterium]|nr:DUF3145 domain-containing protein [Actinomycetes bacterium]